MYCAKPMLEKLQSVETRRYNCQKDKFKFKNYIFHNIKFVFTIMYLITVTIV